MKILHTADLHIRDADDERWNALKGLLELGKKQGADVFVVSGDLFDAEADADRLRPRIRELFSNTGLQILLLPGNHDMNAYRSGMYFGNDAVVLTDYTTPCEIGDVQFWGFPFEHLTDSEILERVRTSAKAVQSDKTAVLLIHGELLDQFYSRHDFGDEGRDRYLPVRISYFKDAPFDYVLAGHFHTSFDVHRLKNGGFFVYPGSPISLTKKELGRRKVNLFEIGEPPGELLLDTPHYEEVIVELDPIRANDPGENVSRRLDALHPGAKVLLTVKGYIHAKDIGKNENDLAREIDRIGEACAERRYEFRDVQSILDDEIFIKFNKKVGEKFQDEREKKALREILLRAMIEAGI